jgi:hypothetical protein
VCGEWASMACVVFHPHFSFVRLCMRYGDEMKGRARKSISVIDDGDEELRVLTRLSTAGDLFGCVLMCG